MDGTSVILSHRNDPPHTPTTDARLLGCLWWLFLLFFLLFGAVYALSMPNKPETPKYEDAPMSQQHHTSADPHAVLLRASARLQVQLEAEMPLGAWLALFQSAICGPLAPDPRQDKPDRAGQRAEGAPLALPPPPLSHPAPGPVEGIYRDMALSLLDEMEDHARARRLDPLARCNWSLQRYAAKICPQWWEEKVVGRARMLWSDWLQKSEQLEGVSG